MCCNINSDAPQYIFHDNIISHIVCLAYLVQAVFRDCNTGNIISPYNHPLFLEFCEKSCFFCTEILAILPKKDTKLKYIRDLQ